MNNATIISFLHHDKPPRCSGCGKPNPTLAYDYTDCCEEEVTYPDEDKFYRFAKQKWDSDQDDYRYDR